MKGEKRQYKIKNDNIINFKGKDEITVNGKIFKSFSEACRYYNLNYSMVWNRLNKGWTIEEAFGLGEKEFHHHMKEITLNGKTFKSIKEATKYYNLNTNLVQKRLSRGWTNKEAFGLVKRKRKYRNKRKQITVEGKTFESITEACKYYNINYSLVLHRLKRGWTIEEAFGLVKRKRKYRNKRKQITVEGRTYKSIKEACDYYNLSEGMVYCRLRRGISIDEAFGLIPRKRKYGTQKEITVGNKTFESIAEACRYYNIDRIKINNRVRKGWTMEEAFELVHKEDNRGKKGTSITLEGKTFKSIKEATKYYNLNTNLVQKRLSRGWTNKEAFGLVKRKYSNKRKQITVEGRTFKSVIEVAKYYNLNYNMVYNRLRKGWTIEEAFELVTRKRKYGAQREITVGGKTFTSIAEAARYYNVDKIKVNNRLRKGWTIEETFELVEKENNKGGAKGKPITVEDKTFDSIREAARYYNLVPGTVDARLKRGWTIEEVFGLVKRNCIHKGKPIIVEGKKFNSIKEAAKYYNLSYNIIRLRLNKGWTIEEAFELVKREKECFNKPVTIEGKTFETVVVACKYYNNLDPDIIKNKLKHKWSIAEAFDLYITTDEMYEMTLYETKKVVDKIEKNGIIGGYAKNYIYK